MTQLSEKAGHHMDMSALQRSSRAKILDVREQRRLAAPLEFREDKDNHVVLEGYAATYEPYDCYGGVERGGWIEKIDRRAFDVTLAQSPDVQLLLNHEGLPLARTTSRTLQLTSDKRGLKVRAILDASDPDVQRILPKMRRGDLNEMSFAFRVKDQVWSNDYTQRTITEVSLQRGDVSVVSYGMNPDTKATVEMLARMSQDDLVELRKLDRDEIEKAISVLAQATDTTYSVPAAGVDDLRAAGDPSSPAGNPQPNMQDSVIVADKEKDTDPSDPAGTEIESGIHAEPAVTKTGDADAPVKKIIEAGSSPLMGTLVAALQSTISHAYSVANSNNDSARALIADAVEQIEKIAAEISDTPPALKAPLSGSCGNCAAAATNSRWSPRCGKWLPTSLKTTKMTKMAKRNAPTPSMRSARTTTSLPTRKVKAILSPKTTRKRNGSSPLMRF